MNAPLWSHISYFTMFTSTSCVLLFIEYIEGIKIAITEFLLFVLTTLGGMSSCDANDLITIGTSRMFTVYAPTYYLDLPRKMYGLIRLLRNIYSRV